MARITKTYMSIVLPVYNEEENIKLQYENIINNVEPLKKGFEVIFVNDGSTDQSANLIEEIAKKDKRIKLINFRRNFGQTAAMAAGIDFASGEVIIFMDSDLQNDAEDIKNLLTKIDEGYDVVSGWRKHRQDKLVSRKIPSKIANRLIAKVSGVKLHDLGCSLKAYRADVIKEVRLYGEMHRFIPIHASWVGANITEIPVNHHPRQFGESKYGIKRTFKVLLDLMTINFMSKFKTKPNYLYGGIGFVSFFFSFCSLLAVILMKCLANFDMTGNPLLYLTMAFFFTGVIFLLMGIQAEILIRIYHESSATPPYHVRNTVNLKK